MNSHIPFDAGNDWTLGPYHCNSSNDPLVDKVIGNAYAVVREVYCNLGNLKLLYDFLNTYGMVLGVKSEAELKKLNKLAKFARIYGFANTGDRQVTDYLYVPDDTSGIRPDDPTATGSWIKVASSTTGGGEGDGGQGSYIPYVYANGSAVGGETSFKVPEGTQGVPFVVINGSVRYIGYGFDYNVATSTVTLSNPLVQGDEVIALTTAVPANPDNPDVSNWVQVNWLYNNGSAVGGEQVITIPYSFKDVPAIYKNGMRLYKNLQSNSYTIDPDTRTVTMTEILAQDDRIIVTLGGESGTLRITDRTIQEVARANDVKDDDVVLSTNTHVVITEKKVLYDVSAQKAWVIPNLPPNAYIVKVEGNQLTYNPGNVTVTLVSTFQDTNTRELWKRSLAEAGLNLVDGSFEEGGVLTNKTDVLWHVSGGQCYTWAGTLPKVVPEDSTPNSSDAVGWISVSNVNALTSLSKAVGYFTPEMFGAAKTFDVNVDDQPFVDKAILAAEAAGSKCVVLQREYNLIAAPYRFKTPGDDGTVHPDWLAAGDINLEPEDRPEMPVHLRIMDGTRLIGLSKKCGLRGTWNPATSIIDISQPAMLLVTRPSTSRYLGTLTNDIGNFKPSNFFVGIIYEGIVFQSTLANFKPTNCGIGFIAHANENSMYTNVDFSGCYAGGIIGGWWNFRARISGGNATSVYVPPYDGVSGQNLMGWCDGANFYNLGYSVADRKWGDRHENFDTWFQRYFYKNGNSSLTSAGGRASNNTDPTDTATYSPFYGITSRALTILSRNGRGNGNNNVTKLRTNGTHRAPLFVNRANRCVLKGDVHLERSGWTDADLRNSIFGVDYQDPRRPAGYLQATLSEGFIHESGDYDVTASVSSKPLSPGRWKTLRSSTVDGSSNLVGGNSYPQEIIWAQDGAPYEKILDRVRMQGNNAPDPVNGTDLYIKTTDYYRIPALVLGSSAYRFVHQQGTFTPVVKIGGTVVNPSGTPRGFYERIGDTVKCWINFYESGVDLSTLTGQVTIEGLPFALTVLESTTTFPIVIGVYIKTNAVGLSATMSGTTLSLRKNYSSAIFQGSDFLSGTEHFLQLQVEYTVAKTGA